MKADTRGFVIFTTVGCIAAGGIGYAVWQSTSPEAQKVNEKSSLPTTTTSLADTKPTSSSSDMPTPPTAVAPTLINDPLLPPNAFVPQSAPQATPTKLFRPQAQFPGNGAQPHPDEPQAQVPNRQQPAGPPQINNDRTDNRPNNPSTAPSRPGPALPHTPNSTATPASTAPMTSENAPGTVPGVQPSPDSSPQGGSNPGSSTSPEPSPAPDIRHPLPGAVLPDQHLPPNLDTNQRPNLPQGNAVGGSTPTVGGAGRPHTGIGGPNGFGMSSSGPAARAATPSTNNNAGSPALDSTAQSANAVEANASGTNASDLDTPVSTPLVHSQDALPALQGTG